MPVMIDVTPPAESQTMPAEVRPSGLEAFDLSVKATQLSISWNREALESAVNAVIEQYDGFAVTEDQVPAVKSEMAGLNKLKDKLLAAKRDIVNAIKAPVDEFDREVTAMIGKLTTTRSALDEQVKEFERLDRESRRAAVQFMIDAAKDKAGLADFNIPINERWLNKTAKTSTTAAEIENLCLKESMRRTESLQLERAKQDRVTLVGETVKREAERHGFDLPMGKFQPCMSLEISGEEAMSLIAQAFAAESTLREQAKAAQIPPPPASVPLRTPLTEVDPLPQAFEPAQAQFPEPQAEPDPWELPTVESVSTEQAPPSSSVESISLTLSFATENRAAVLELLDSLRMVAAVTIN